LLGFDEDLVSSADSMAAREAAIEHAHHIAECGNPGNDTAALQECFFERVFVAEGSFSPTATPTDVNANTATYALTTGKGSCAAVAAAILALADEQHVPLQALVLRNHVVLADALQEDVFFEVLEGAQPLGTSDLANYSPPPGGPLRRFRPRSRAFGVSVLLT